MIINHALALDPNAAGYLKKLQRKCLAITILSLEKTLFVLFLETGIKLTLIKPETIDVTIKGPIKAFINLAITKNTHQSAQMGLSFEGDFNTVEAAQQLFLSLDIDWEEAIAPWTGDIVAHQIGQFACLAKKRHAALLDNTLNSVADYLKEESKILPTPVEINHFMNQVDVLRADVDRLEARLLQLQLAGAIS